MVFSFQKVHAAQDTLSFQEVNIKTYQYYLEQKWDSVILIGSQALRQHIDYYYLRMRMGIAYFQKKEYRIAEPHFLRALKFNSSDDVAKEYLYYCYTYSEQYDYAGKLSASFSDSLTKKLHTGYLKPIDVIYVDAGEKLSSDTAQYHNAFFFNAEAYSRLSKSISIFESYTYYNQTAYWGNVQQNDFYVKTFIPFSNQWLLTPAVHFFFLNALPYYFNSIHYAASVECQRSFDLEDIGASFSYSDVAHSTQLQETVFLTYYPFGNNKLSIKATLLLQEDSVQDRQAAAWADVNFKPVSRVTLSTGYYRGNAVYINQWDAYLVDNAVVLTTSKFYIRAAFDVSRHFNIYALYQYENTSDIFANIPFHYTTVLIGSKIIL